MSSTSDDMIAYLKASVLDENRPLLCTNLDPKLHYPYLRSKYVMSRDDEELVEVQQLKKLKVHKFIDILMTKGRHGFDELIVSIIQERTQIFLAEKLNKAFEEKRKRLHALTAQNDGRGATVEGQELQTIQDLSISSSDRTDFNGTVTNTTGSQSDKTNEHSVQVLDRLRNSMSDLGVDTEKLPRPTMPNDQHNRDDSNKARIRSCENSFDEDSDEVKSLPDSESSLKESKA